MEASIRYGQFVSVMRDGLQLVRQGELRNGLQTLRSAITLASDLIGTKDIDEDMKRDLESGKNTIFQTILEIAETALAEQPPAIQPRNHFEIDDLLVQPDSTVFLGDVVGLEYIKETLIKAVIFPLKLKNLVPGDNPINGLLLYGASGTGKTKVLKAFINTLAVTIDAKVNFYNASMDKILGSFHGDTEKNLTRIFSHINNSGTKSVIIIDEIDGLCGNRGKGRSEQSDIKITNHLLTLLDGLSSGNVIVFATTNRPHEMDPSLYRRFVLLHAELPTKKEKERILRALVSKVQKDATGIDFPGLVAETYGFSPADLKRLVTLTVLEVRFGDRSKQIRIQMERKEDILFPVPRSSKVTPLKKITNADLFKQLDYVHATNDTGELFKLEQFSWKYGNKRLDFANQTPDMDFSFLKNAWKNPCETFWLFMAEWQRFFSLEI